MHYTKSISKTLKHYQELRRQKRLENNIIIYIVLPACLAVVGLYFIDKYFIRWAWVCG